ncbi:MAG TPA: PilZ domain-containing protein, partial [Elusimicrobiota bacterium]|nr:PilZ domain-containing protein [Elusimicrobiota bacterium]
LMNKGRSASKESLFLWSADGVQRIRKRVRGFFSAPAVSSAVPPAPAADPRRYPRLDLKLPILYRVLSGGVSRLPPEIQPCLLAQSTNVSPIGLCLDLAEEMAPETVLALTIHVVDRREKFSAVGRVVWSKPSPQPGHFLTGLEFVVVKGENVKKEDHVRMEALTEEYGSLIGT